MKKFMLALLLLCCSCDPVFETVYSYKPPNDISGRECANQCISAKQRCISSTKTQNAIYDLVNSQRTGDTLKYTTNNYDDYCDSDYRTCHVNCGGKVIEKKVCVSFCDKIKK